MGARHPDGQPARDLRRAGRRPDRAPARLHGTQVSGEQVVRMIDEFPAFAVAAAFADGPTEVRRCRRSCATRNRTASAPCAPNCARWAWRLRKPRTAFILPGGGVRGGQVDPHGDHRLAMALAVAGLAADGPVRVSRSRDHARILPGFCRRAGRAGRPGAGGITTADMLRCPPTSHDPSPFRSRPDRPPARAQPFAPAASRGPCRAGSGRRIPPVPGGAAAGRRRHALAELIGRLRSGDLHGLNVTIPHKQAVLPAAGCAFTRGAAPSGRPIPSCCGTATCWAKTRMRRVSWPTCTPAWAQHLPRSQAGGRWCWERAARPARWCMPWRGPAGRCAWRRAGWTRPPN